MDEQYYVDDQLHFDLQCNVHQMHGLLTTLVDLGMRKDPSVDALLADLTEAQVVLDKVQEKMEALYPRVSRVQRALRKNDPDVDPK